MTFRRRPVTLLLVALLVLAGAVPAAGQTTVPIRRLAGATRVETAVAVSAMAFDTARTVVVARADDPADALAGAPLAASLGGPLLLTPTDAVPSAVRDELDRLGAEEVVLLGGPGALPRALASQFGDRSVRRLFGRDRVGTAIAIARARGPARVAYVAGVAGQVDALAAGAAGATAGRPVLLVDDDPARLRPVLDELGVEAVRVVGGPAAVSDAVVADLAGPGRRVRRLAGPDRYATAARIARDAVAAGADPERVWVATGRSLPDSLAAGPAVAAVGGVLLLLDGHDPWSTRPADELLRAWQPGRVMVLGGPQAVSETIRWQLPVMLAGPRLPGGGAALFPHHRLVALYGHHASPALGVLGEQSPQEAFDRLAPLARPFGADGRVVLPTFELIVSLATASAGPDGDYSAPSTRQQIQPWLDAARAHGVYLLLDLQPGRTDFLTEARRYEDLLREPDVGLALDPEWRLGPDEVHLEQVGSVDASEVNRVSQWLAGLVRDEGLPQKLFVVHQFQLRMIRDREQLQLRPELATLIQMDGQGSRSAKLSTYDTLTRAAGPWRHGFKLFFDEDPDIFQPHEVLRLAPVPDFVSYQ
jgi:putative cell wall-binding protein